jgi:hypothetical protein
MLENVLSHKDLTMEVEKTAYRRHMKAVSYIPSSARGK